MKHLIGPYYWGNPEDELWLGKWVNRFGATVIVEGYECTFRRCYWFWPLWVKMLDGEWDGYPTAERVADNDSK